MEVIVNSLNSVNYWFFHCGPAVSTGPRTRDWGPLTLKDTSTASVLTAILFYSILFYPYHSLFDCFSDSILICDWSIRNDRFKKKRSNNKVLLVLLLVSHQHVDHMSLLLPRSLHCPVTVGELILNKRPTAENGPSGWNIRQLILIPVAAEAQEQRWSRGVEGDQLLTFPKMQFNHCSPVPWFSLRADNSRSWRAFDFQVVTHLSAAAGGGLNLRNLRLNPSVELYT